MLKDGRADIRTDGPRQARQNTSTGGYLVGWFGFNGPLRQYFSLYRAASQREGEEERKDRRE